MNQTLKTWNKIKMDSTSLREAAFHFLNHLQAKHGHLSNIGAIREIDIISGFEGLDVLSLSDDYFSTL